MRNGEFIINNIHSQDLKAVIQNRPTVNTPRRVTNPVTIPSRSGFVYMDDGVYENTPLDLNIALYGDNFEEADYNRERLIHAFDSGDYVPFRYYVNPHKLHMVHLENSTFSSSRRLRFHQEGAVSLSVYPYKYTHDGVVHELTASGGQLVNPNSRVSEPIIRVEGQGNITLTINDTAFPLVNVNGHLILNTVVEHAYRDNGGVLINEDRKVNTLDYPRLQPGSNVITWAGDVSKVSIEPRWHTII